MKRKSIRARLQLVGLCSRRDILVDAVIFLLGHDDDVDVDDDDDDESSCILKNHSLTPKPRKLKHKQEDTVRK
jgi:hypothetical protein